MPARRQQTPTPCRVQAILPAAVTSHAFPPNNFKHFLTLFSKFFSSFPHGTCSLSVSHQYLALDGTYHPLFAAFPNNKTRRRHFVQQATRRRRGSHPLGRPFPGNLGTGACRSHLDRPQFWGASTADFRLGLFPVRSPLLGESWLVSFPPLIDMLKFSGCSCLNSGRMIGGALRAAGSAERPVQRGGAWPPPQVPVARPGLLPFSQSRGRGEASSSKARGIPCLERGLERR